MTIQQQIPATEGTHDTNAPAVLTVADLTVSYDGHTVVENVSFEVPPGSTVSLIGRSGSGKSTIANAILGLLDPHTSRVRGSVRFRGDEILSLRAKELRQLRGSEIGFIPQDPGSALNPVRRIGAQFDEVLRHAQPGSKSHRRDTTLKVLERVGLPDPARVFRAYPHELSGGMQQRVLIGMAILLDPGLLIADEPTSALDVTVQKTILDLLDDLRSDLGVSILLITHDLSLAAARSDAVVVLNDGAVQEYGTSTQVLRHPRSDYARQLYRDVPGLQLDKYREVKASRQQRLTVDVDEPALRVQNLVKTFGRGRNAHVALGGVSFAVARGTTHALVGESGSGKSTALRTVLRLEPQDSGHVFLNGVELTARDHQSLREVRRNLQLVYQNPFTSLDPQYTVASLIAEPLGLYGVGSARERKERTLELLHAVGLDERVAKAKPSKLSGGQRQRAAIARAIALHPDILLLDEPTSALDVSVQAQILDLLVSLQSEFGLTYLFVSHDLSVVRQFADTVTVLRQGAVVESGRVDEVFENPKEAHTQQLLSSVPWLNPTSA
ncbi:MAG: dipeptide ABC transporter ATP-binding protein [Mycobacterium sp.]